MIAPSPAAERWAEQLAAWAIPEEILAGAPESPWVHDPATFAVDDTLRRDSVSAVRAREVLPARAGVVLDVGCGGGRSSLPLVPPAERLVGVDENPAMLTSFAAAAKAVGAVHDELQGRWPDVAGRAPIVDVVVCHHVVYNVADIEPFLLALTEHARLAVVVELPVRHPQSTWNAAWRHFWRVERPAGPTSDDLWAVLGGLGLDPEGWTSERSPVSRYADDPEALVRSTRRRLCLPAERDAEIAAWLAEHQPAWPTEVVTLRWPGTGDASS